MKWPPWKRSTDDVDVVADATIAPPEATETAETGHSTQLGSDYLTDAPVHEVSNDRFGRGRWARRVAETIIAQQDAASLVVGIYAPWGDGKTSVLNFIFDKLNKTDDIIPVRFNPWLVGDEAELFQGFFETLADALEDSLTTGSERAGQVLRDYGGLFGVFPGLDGALQAAGNRMSETNLTKERVKVERLLAKHSKRVVILIDDIDRLDKSEIQAMFRLVKVAADFQHTAYVLSFDHRVVATALAERYQTDASHGANFMDKIVQLPLHLPPAPPDRLRQLALEAVSTAVEQAGIELTDAETGAFISVFDRAIGPHLTTPRAAKRYGNALLFAMPMLGREVHPVDLMLAEAMRICHPSLYEWVRSHERDVLGPYANDTSTEDPPLSTIRDALATTTGGLDPLGAARAQILLTTLFPRTESAFTNKGWGADWDTPWTEEKRIASSRYFRRYFTYSVPPGDVADADIDALLAAVSHPDPDNDNVITLALDVLSTETADQVLPRLAARSTNLTSEAATNLAIVIAADSPAFPDRTSFLGLSTLDRAAVLIRDLFRQVEPELRGELATTLIGDPYYVPFSIELIRWLRTSKGEDRNDAPLTPIEEDQVGRALAQRLIDIWRTDDPLPQFGRKIAGAMHLCDMYGQGDLLRDELRRHIDKDAGFAIDVIRAFLGQSWSAETGQPLPSRLRRESYRAVNEYIEPARLMPRLQGQFGNDIGTEKAEPDHVSDDSYRLAHEYAAFYRADLEVQTDTPDKPDGVDEVDTRD